jgi:protein-S-isoprenylcysteine O-methyltransferase Ste14
MGLGLAAGYTSIIAGLAVPLLLLPGLVYRMRVEERFLVEQFGNDYTTYADRTRRLIPGVW